MLYLSGVSSIGSKEHLNTPVTIVAGTLMRPSCIVSHPEGKFIAYIHRLKLNENPHYWILLVLTRKPINKVPTRCTLMGYLGVK